MNLAELQSIYDKRVGAREQVEKDWHQGRIALKRLRKEKLIAEKAKTIVHIVSIETQKQLEYRISDTVSRALEVIFADEAYELSAKFEEKRGKTECLIAFERDGELHNPLTSSGYGAVDIASFALRIACREIENKTNPIFILDEPFKHLKGVEPNRMAIDLLQEVSLELGIQIITVSDERAAKEDIIAGADKVFDVYKPGKYSEIEEL